jgi:hypothetical protein
MEPTLIDTAIATGAGIVTAIGAVVIVLKKLNLISFGKQKVESVDTKYCPDHFDINKRLNGVRERQLSNIEILNQHTENHKENKKDLKEIREALKIIGENIAVLKDRSDREYNSHIGK